MQSRTVIFNRPALFSQQPVAGVGTEWLPGIGDDKCLARQLVQALYNPLHFSHLLNTQNFEIIKRIKRLVKLRATGVELSIPQFLCRMEVENLTRPGVYKRQVSF